MPTYYCNSRGSDFFGDGTMASPFLTFDYAYSQALLRNDRDRDILRAPDTRSTQEVRTGVDQVLRQSYSDDNDPNILANRIFRVPSEPTTIANIVDPETLAGNISARFPERLTFNQPIIGGEYGSTVTRRIPYSQPDSMALALRLTEEGFKFPELSKVIPIPD